MTLEQIMGMNPAEIMSLDDKSLRRIVQQASDAANKRVSRMAKAGLTEAPAYRAAQESGGKFTTKGKDRTQLQNELKRLQQFTTGKTGTSRGARGWYKSFYDPLKEAAEASQWDTDEYIGIIEDLYWEILKNGPAWVASYGSKQIHAAVNQAVAEQDPPPTFDLVKARNRALQILEKSKPDEGWDSGEFSSV